LLAQDAGLPVLLRTADHLEDIQASIVATDDRLARQGDLVRRFMRATVKGQRIYLANRQEGITAIMEFTRHKDRDLMSRVYDDNLKTLAPDGTIPERLQRIVIDRSKRLTSVTREIRPEEIFDFSFLRKAQAEVTQRAQSPRVNILPMYASARRFSRASPLDPFEQPGRCIRSAIRIEFRFALWERPPQSGG
jgi:ABC-type nitrate/sulfonate/bicarbonate transport system substrate-binding protein